jgi:tRNA-specific 2-thiouridylase
MRKNKKKTVFVAMSGGVDSSVAALLLKKQGCKIIGVFMRCFNLDGCSERDAEDARRVAEKLKIPFYVWDFEKVYKKKVVEYMVDGYKKGITPNPDVMCNREIKFGLFLDRALKMGADYVATGHYVQIKRLPNTFAQGVSGATPKSYPSQKRRTSLYIARDLNKDQSYFLWTLTQEQLKHCLFPIGDYFKSEVRKIAQKAGLPTAEKKDSRGICFLGKISLDDFLKKYIPEKKGNVLNVFGEKIGEHKGAHFYTIGQRHGLGIGGSEKPCYVVEKNVKKNIIVVAEGDDNPALYKKEIQLTNINFINPNHYSLIPRSRINSLRGRRANGRITIYARVRYRQPLAKANLKLINLKTYNLIFEQPQKFIASGQSAVFYSEKNEMLGGGVIV